MTMKYSNMPVYPGDFDGLTINQCWPRTLGQYVEAGFALYIGDWYYLQHGAYGPTSYAVPPPAAATNGLTPPTKRDRIYVGDDGNVLVDEGNSTRAVTEEEMRMFFNFHKCQSPGCTKE